MNVRTFCQCRSRSLRTSSFHVLGLQRTATKCAKIFDARVRPLLYSSNLSFGGVAVCVMVSFKSLFWIVTVLKFDCIRSIKIELLSRLSYSLYVKSRVLMKSRLPA